MQIPFLKGDKAKKLQRDLDAARGRQQKIKARLDTAEAQLAESEMVPIKLARQNADEAVLDAAEARVRSAEMRVETLRVAAAEEVAAVATIEQEIAAIEDQAQREQTAVALEGWKSELEQLKADLSGDRGLLARLSAVTDQCSIVCADAHGVAAFSQNARVELISAVELIVDILARKAHGVRSGEGRATLPTRPAPPVPVPARVVERVWTIMPLAWTDDGLTQIRDSGNWVDLPPGLAKTAISKAAAVPLGHERAGKHNQNFRQYHGYGLPELARCVRLDDETETALAEEKSRREEQHVVLHSSADPTFQPLDRGKPFVLRTPAGNPTPGEAA
jgi:hypothetical protein